MPLFIASLFLIVLFVCAAGTAPRPILTDMLRKQFASCWKPEDDKTRVIVQLNLSIDGTISEAVLEPSQALNYNNNPRFKAAADNVLKAVHQCSPLKNLPADGYLLWKDMILIFDPSNLL